MKHDEANVVIDNVLTEEEILQVVAAVDKSHGTDFVSVHCQTNNFIELPQNIINKFTEHAKTVSGNTNLVLTEFCHSIYKNREVDGKKYRPSLFPHYDETFKAPRFTLDYQLKSTLDWPIVVEPDTELILKDNQAATFSGTNQVHWRTPTEFSENDSIEMIFCHFSDPSIEKKDSQTNDAMDSKVKKYKEIFYSTGGFSNDGGKSEGYRGV
jgi:hypothetical protein